MDDEQKPAPSTEVTSHEIEHVHHGEVTSSLLRTIVILLVGVALGFGVASLILQERPQEISVPTKTVTLPESEEREEEEAVSAVEDEVTEEAVRTALTINWQNPLSEVDESAIELEPIPDTEVYYLGTIASGPLQEQLLYLISYKCDGPCGKMLYRVIWNPELKTRILLTNLSNVVDEALSSKFEMTDDYDIPDLHAPETLSTSYNGKTITFEREAFSPAVLLKSYTTERNNALQATNFNFGMNINFLEDTVNGSFVVELPDHTVELYRLRFPFTLASESATGLLIETANLAITLDDGTKLDGSYSPIRPSACPPRQYDVFTGIDSRLTKIGETTDGESFYRTTEPTDPLTRDLFDQSNSDEHLPGSYDFWASYKVIFWQDALGRSFRLRDLSIYPTVETECGYFDSVL